MKIEESEAVMIDALCLIIPALGGAINQGVPLSRTHLEVMGLMIEMLNEVSQKTGLYKNSELVKKWPALKSLAKGNVSLSLLETGLDELCHFTYEAETSFIIYKMQESSESIMQSMKKILDKAGE